MQRVRRSHTQLLQRGWRIFVDVLEVCLTGDTMGCSVMRIRTVCPRISRAIVSCPPDSGCLVTPARAGWTGKLAPSARNCSRAMGASTCGFLRGSKADRRDIEQSTSGSPHPDMQRGHGLLHLGTERPALIQCLISVDYLVSLNDPIAESLKDGTKNPYADACRRGQR